MTCPFCGNEMEKGILSGDGRSPVTWRKGDRKTGVMEQIAGVGTVTAARRTLASFTIESYFCRGCQKMIFDTDVTR